MQKQTTSIARDKMLETLRREGRVSTTSLVQNAMLFCSILKAPITQTQAEQTMNELVQKGLARADGNADLRASCDRWVYLTMKAYKGEK